VRKKDRGVNAVIMGRIDVERASHRQPVEARAPVVRTDAVNVVFTTPADTLAAARVAQRMAQAMGCGVRLVHFHICPTRLTGDEPSVLAREDLEAIAARIQAEVGTLATFLYVGSLERQVLPFAFRPHSLVVLAGRRRWWKSASERWRRLLEDAGHRVVFVDMDTQAHVDA
jgi:hypothetical protein